MPDATDLRRSAFGAATRPAATPSLLAAEFVALAASQPTAIARLLADHIDDGAGHFRVCSGQAGPTVWPCRLHGLAAHARAQAAVGRPAPRGDRQRRAASRVGLAPRLPANEAAVVVERLAPEHEHRAVRIRRDETGSGHGDVPSDRRGRSGLIRGRNGGSGTARSRGARPPGGPSAINATARDHCPRVRVLALGAGPAWMREVERELPPVQAGSLLPSVCAL